MTGKAKPNGTSIVDVTDPAHPRYLRAEVDGVADLDMIAADFTPLAAGEPLSVGDMAGRQRAYTLLLPHGQRSPAFTDQAKAAMTSLLTSERVTNWIDRQLDGR